MSQTLMAQTFYGKLVFDA